MLSTLFVQAQRILGARAASTAAADSAAGPAAAPALDWERIIVVDWGQVLQSLLRVVVIVALAWLSYRVLELFLRRLERSLAPAADATVVTIQEQRMQTLLGLLRSVGIVVILLITLFMALTAIGVQIAPLLAGAGVVGLAISFGSQSLVRDILSGLFILFENQFGVGDVVRLGDVSGRVERMTLRVVVLRDLHGVVHIVPNGEIKRVSNLTRSFSRAVVEIGVGFQEDAERVMQVMREVADEIHADPQWRPLLTDPIEVPGIEAFGEYTMTIRMLATTVPLKQWDVARELRLRLKKRFDAEGIRLPVPHRVLHWAEAGGARVAAPGETPDRG